MAHVEYLNSALAKYSYPDMAKRDAMAVLGSFTRLRPQLSMHVFNDGTVKELLCLEGTIPVVYKGNTHNIPVCLWLLDSHPYNPPMVFIKPTSGTQIKQGRHVDNNGRIYLPYLHEWKHPGSDLTTLVQILACLFGEELPVFASNQPAQIPFSAPISHLNTPPRIAVNGPVCITQASALLPSTSADPPRRICVICFTASCDPVALVPCGHARFCRPCCTKLPQKNLHCPLCNENVFNILNLHF